MQEEEIAEDPIKDDWQSKHHQVVLRDVVRGKRIKGIRHKARGGCHSDKAVEKFQRVVLQRWAMGLRLIRNLEKFRASLPHGDEQGTQHCANVEPGGDTNLGSHRPRDDPDYESARNREEIDKHEVLPPHGVGGGDQCVAGARRRESCTEGGGECRPQHEKAGSRACCNSRRYIASRERAESLRGMKPIGGEIPEVVEDVAGAGDEAERNKADERTAYRRSVRQMKRID